MPEVMLAVGTHRSPAALKLRSKHGMAGWGVYTCLLELMRESPDISLQCGAEELGALAFGLHCELELLEAVVTDCIQFGLFTFSEDESSFYCPAMRADVERFNARSRLYAQNRKGKFKNSKNEGGAHSLQQVTESKEQLKNNCYSIVEPLLRNEAQVKVKEEGSGEKPKPKNKPSTVVRELKPAETPDSTAPPDTPTLSKQAKTRLEKRFSVRALAHYEPLVAAHVAAHGKEISSFEAYIEEWMRRDEIDKKGIFAAKNQRNHHPPPFVAPVEVEDAVPRKSTLLADFEEKLRDSKREA
jgi:hypothetical protein